MSSGELLVLVGALSAIVGAIGGLVGGLGLGASVGAYVNHLLSERAKRDRRKSELEGLLRLAAMEIDFNRALVLEDYLHKDPREYFLAANPGRPLSTDVWKQARPRIAQLLPAHRFTSLVEYYANVQSFNNLLDEHTPPKIRTRDLPGAADSLANRLGPEVTKWMRDDYIGRMSIDPPVSVNE
jgi:hypothetical protein